MEETPNTPLDRNGQDAPPVSDAPPMSMSTPSEQVFDQPGKLLRIAMMVRETLEEVRRAPLDQDARKHLADVHDRVVEELKSAMSPPLAEELARVTLPFDDGEVPTESELRIAQAQLLGWLEGLFQGIQAAIASQQMQMSNQLEEMRRRALTSGEEQERTGPYL